MTLALVPIPVGGLEQSAPIWVPFVQAIAARGKWHLDVLLCNVMSGDVHICLIWDSDAQVARALIGLRFMRRGDDLVGEIIWLTGMGRRDWTGLLPDLERYLREHHGCVHVMAHARPGWMRTLKPAGYRMTHVTMEKAL